LFQEQHPEGIEVARCPECRGTGQTVKAAAQRDATDELVACERCSETGWIEVAG
jgi:hypothetical protein